MKMENKNTAGNNFVTVYSREQGFVTCPHCWTDQRTDRDFCYRCGAVFIYKDELKDEAEEKQAGRALTRSA